MKNLLKLTFIFLPFFAFSQVTIGLGMGENKGEGTIYTKDGKQIDGEIKYPKYSDKQVKLDNNKFESKEIDSIVFANCTFIYTKGKDYLANKKDYKYFKNEGWMCRVINGKASLYLYGQQYGFKKDKMFVNKGEVRYYAMRKGEDVPSLIGIDTQGFQAGYSSYFRNLASNYFSNNNEIKSKIENKEYSVKEIELLINDFNSM